jgi:hypothetical protein
VTRLSSLECNPRASVGRGGPGDRGGRKHLGINQRKMVKVAGNGTRAYPVFMGSRMVMQDRNWLGSWMAQWVRRFG